MVETSTPNIFYRRWIDEYLQTLKTRRKWTHSCPYFNVKDIVFVCEKSYHVVPGRLLECWRSTIVFTEVNDLSNYWYAEKRRYDLFLKSASSNIINDFYVNSFLLLPLSFIIVGFACSLTHLAAATGGGGSK